MAQNSKKNATPIVMDARKFVRHINNGAAAKLRFFEEAVQRMGKNVNRNLRLTSLDSSSIIYEDVDKNAYYVADIAKAGRGRVSFDNIRQIQVVEEEKANQFNQNCMSLVEAVCNEDFKSADKVFSKIESQRFRNRVIPESGWMTLKDGIARHIPVNRQIVKEDHARNIINLFKEATQDTVKVDRGKIVSCTISDDTNKFVIPVNEYTRRRIIARKMRTVAENAYKSGAFSDLVVEVASLICENRVSQAVKLASKFLREEQEFCMLDSDGMQELVENALATRCEFNSMLANDTATLLHRTNLRVNRDSIVEAWSRMAQKAENANLLNNVSVLAESDNFESDHDKFLDIVFNEEADVQASRAQAYLTAIKVIAAALPDLGDEDEELSSSLDELDELMARLRDPEPDTDAVQQAEELLASLSDNLVDQVHSLENFDADPGDEDELGGEDEDEDGEMLELPEVEGDEEEEEEDLGGIEAEEAPPMGEEPMGGEGMPESYASKFTPVEQMSIADLNEELESWQIYGDTYLAEDGYADCFDQMDRYIGRCIEVGPKASMIREQFESMRDRMVMTGDEILSEDESIEDLYSRSVQVALGDEAVSSDPEADPNFWSDQIRSESRINRNYRHILAEEQPGTMSGGLRGADGLSMRDLQGEGGVESRGTRHVSGRDGSGADTADGYEMSGGLSGKGHEMDQSGGGVQSKGLRSADGRKGDGAETGDDYEMSGGLSGAGSLRMDDLQGGGGVQSKSLGHSDGRRGRGAGQMDEEAGVAAGGPSSAGERMSDLQGGGGVQNKSVHKGKHGGQGASASENYTASGGLRDAGLRMDDLQGGDGVEDSGMDSALGKSRNEGSLTEPASGGDASGMGKGQGGGGVKPEKGKGFAESMTIENIAAMIEGEQLDEEWGPGNPLYDHQHGGGKDKKDKKDKNGANGTNGTNGDSKGGHDQDGDKKPDKDGDGKPDWADKDDDSKDKDPEEAQYKGPSKKYHSPGYEKSRLAAEGKGFAEDISDLDSILDALTESDDEKKFPFKKKDDDDKDEEKDDKEVESECMEGFEDRLGDALTISEGTCSCSGGKCECGPDCECGCKKDKQAMGEG